jgi:N-acetylglutamate synthase-like GNAT family acetyltransferase
MVGRCNGVLRLCVSLCSISFVSLGSAFVHFNTGISEFEYFGHGRYLVMGSNQTPHFQPNQYAELRSGGSLKDGWSYVMPTDEFVMGAEVSVAFSDELEGHVREQTEALKSLYLSSRESEALASYSTLDVEAETKSKKKGELNFIVKRGLQVVGVATYSEATGQLTDLAVAPSTDSEKIGETLMNAVKMHARKLGRSGSLIVHPRSNESKPFFQAMGFSEIDGHDVEKMESKID